MINKKELKHRVCKCKECKLIRFISHCKFDNQRKCLTCHKSYKIKDYQTYYTYVCNSCRLRTAIRRGKK